MNTVVTADAFSQYDHHTVRIYDPATHKLVRRAIRVGDKASLLEFVDWMLSPSSNSAAGMVMRETMLLRQFGAAYPPPEDEIKRFFKDTPKPELTALYDKIVRRAGGPQRFCRRRLRQGSFSPRAASAWCPAPATATRRRTS